MLRCHLAPVLVAQQVLQQDLQAERQAARSVDRVQPVDHVIGLTRPQRGPALEAVRRHGVPRLLRLRCSFRGIPLHPPAAPRRWWSGAQYLDIKLIPLSTVDPKSLDVKLNARAGPVPPVPSAPARALTIRDHSADNPLTRNA